MAELKECHICGAEVEPDAAYCTECGADFKKESKYDY